MRASNHLSLFASVLLIFALVQIMPLLYLANSLVISGTGALGFGFLILGLIVSAIGVIRAKYRSGYLLANLILLILLSQQLIGVVYAGSFAHRIFGLAVASVVALLLYVLNVSLRANFSAAAKVIVADPGLGLPAAKEPQITKRAA